jgi:hypothetical protein
MSGHPLDTEIMDVAEGLAAKPQRQPEAELLEHLKACGLCRKKLLRCLTPLIVEDVNRTRPGDPGYGY